MCSKQYIPKLIISNADYIERLNSPRCFGNYISCIQDNSVNTKIINKYIYQRYSYGTNAYKCDYIRTGLNCSFKISGKIRPIINLK